MLVYQTDYTGNGRYIGVTEADPDPVEKGRWLVPAGAVLTPPPTVQPPSYARWDGAAWQVYTPPVAPPAPEPEPLPEPERVFSFLEFMDLFTPAEQASLAGAAMTDVQIKLWYDRAMGAQGIYMSDQRTIDGVQIMVASNLLSAERGQMVLKGVAP